MARGFGLKDQGEAIMPIAGKGHNILHLDTHVADNWIYWVDFEEDKNNGIYRIKPDGADRQHVIKVIFIYYSVLAIRIKKKPLKVISCDKIWRLLSLIETIQNW